MSLVLEPRQCEEVALGTSHRSRPRRRPPPRADASKTPVNPAQPVPRAGGSDIVQLMRRVYRHSRQEGRRGVGLVETRTGRSQRRESTKTACLREMLSMPGPSDGFRVVVCLHVFALRDRQPAILQGERIPHSTTPRNLRTAEVRSADVLRQVTRAAKRKREADHEYEQAITRTGRLGLSHREIAGRRRGLARHHPRDPGPRDRRRDQRLRRPAATCAERGERARRVAADGHRPCAGVPASCRASGAASVGRGSGALSSPRSCQPIVRS